MTSHPISTRRIATPLGAVHTALGGVGAPILFLHPTPLSHAHFAALFPHLTDSYRIIAPDTLGFGDSDPVPTDVTMDALAGAMVALLDAVGVSRAYVYGFHTGNKIGAALAALHPDRVDKVILAGQTHSLIDDKTARDAAIRPFAEKFLGPTPPADPDAYRRWRSSGPLYRANFAFDLGAAVRQIAAPTLILEFATAAEAHFGIQAPALAAAMKIGRAQVLNDTGAKVHIEQPELIARIVRGFFG